MDLLTTVIAEKAAEETVSAVAQVVTDTGFVNKLLGKVSLALGDCFQRYLRNAEASYNQVRTLATEPDLRACRKRGEQKVRHDGSKCGILRL